MRPQFSFKKMTCPILAIALMMLAGISCKKTELLIPLSGKDNMALLAKETQTSIYTLEKIKLGGIDQTILISGESTMLPVLLLLHGGPGFPEMPFFRTFNTDLEKHFLVVNWDQRGAGLSYSPSIPLATMNIEQFINDAHELITILKNRFNKEKIFVLGHSWGTIIGINLVKGFPADFYAYVGAGQVVNVMESEKRSFQFTLQKAITQLNLAAILELSVMIGRYPQKSERGIQDMMVQRKWLTYFGGTLYQQSNYDSMLNRVTAKEMALYDSTSFWGGLDFSLSALWLEILDTDFIKTAPQLNVPVYLLTGRHDYTTHFALTQQYYNLLKAPRKTLIWFEQSAHVVAFEEPVKFNDLMINTVLKETPLLKGDSR